MLDSEKQKKTNPEKKPTKPNPKTNQQEKKQTCKMALCAKH